jgi:hypothetical protein
VIRRRAGDNAGRDTRLLPFAPKSGHSSAMATTVRHASLVSPDTPTLPTAVTTFQCPVCEGPLTGKASGGLGCQSCGHEVVVRDGIIDFVGGAATTRLDNID